MHIVQALVALNVGGSELVATELAEYLALNGHQVTVIAKDGRAGTTHPGFPGQSAHSAPK